MAIDATPLNDVLKKLYNKLQAEDDLNIAEAIDVYSRCDENYKENLLIVTGFNGVLTESSLRQHFDMLELMDVLDDIVKEMKIIATINSGEAVNDPDH